MNKLEQVADFEQVAKKGRLPHESTRFKSLFIKAPTKAGKKQFTYPGFGTFVMRLQRGSLARGSQRGQRTDSLWTFVPDPGLKKLLDRFPSAAPVGRRTSHHKKQRRTIDARLAQAEEAIFRLPMLDAAEVSELLGSRSTNPRQYAARLRREGALIGLPRGNRYAYPRFQIDERTRLPYPAIKTVGNLLDSANDPWGVVSWWTSSNSRLPEQQTPMELLGTESDVERLTALAQGLVADVG
jgi:hypothetical protein